MKNSKKLIGAVAALVVALVISVGSTFAWFTTNNKVTISQIEATVTTGSSNLEIAYLTADGNVSENGFAYTLDLSKEDEFKAMIGHLKFDALTNQGQWTDNAWAGATNKNGLELRDRNGGKDLAKAATTTADGSYIAFTVRFRTPASNTTAAGVELKLSTTSKVTSSHAEAPLYSPIIASDDSLNTPFGFAKDMPVNVAAADAMRVAFHEVKDNALVKADGSTGKVWTPVAANTKYEGKNLAQHVEAMLGGPTKTVESFNNLYNDPGYDAYTLGTDFASSGVVVTLKNDSAENPVYCTADLRIIIWLEGTDSECLNSIFSDNVFINLGFEVLEVAAKN